MGDLAVAEERFDPGLVVATTAVTNSGGSGASSRCSSPSGTRARVNATLSSMWTVLGTAPGLGGSRGWVVQAACTDPLIVSNSMGVSHRSAATSSIS